MASWRRANLSERHFGNLASSNVRGFGTYALNGPKKRSEPGHRDPVANLASRGPGRNGGGTSGSHEKSDQVYRGQERRPDGAGSHRSSDVLQDWPNDLLSRQELSKSQRAGLCLIVEDHDVATLDGDAVERERCACPNAIELRVA